TGSAILLVAQDHTSFSDFDFSGLVSDDDFFTPQFGEGTVGSSRPKVILVTLDGSPTLPDLAPEARDEGFSLKTLVTTLPSTISGTLRAFDISGREIDADAAVLLLDPDATIASAPEATQVRVQLVDVWGGVLEPGTLPVSAIEFDPALADFDATRGVSTLTFPDNERRLKLSTAKSDSELEADVAEGERYRHRHAYVAVWPGYEFDFHEISGNEIELNLNEAVAEETTPPNFLRLCIWHPTQTMQTTIGGGINQAGEFALATPAEPANELRLYGRADTASVVNDGLTFFRDFYAEVEAAKEGDELYLTNWKASAHLHLRGSLTAYGIESAEIDRASIDDALTVIDQQRILVALDGGDKRFVLLADSGGRGDSLRDSFHAEVRTLPDITTKAKEISAGFLRPGEPYALILGGENGAPDPQQVTASWKNPFGEVDTTSKTLSPLPTMASPGDFPDAVALGIDAQDPPQATVIRTTTFGEIQNVVGPSAASLLVINVSAGTSTYFDLSVDPTAED
ncbi:MAG: hypothetical protein U9P00_11670, partial [Pseudomonadota bacterium]|nr:hypothetical protein [Pseudomonadota bacterium]